MREQETFVCFGFVESCFNHISLPRGDQRVKVKAAENEITVAESRWGAAVLEALPRV